MKRTLEQILESFDDEFELVLGLNGLTAAMLLTLIQRGIFELDMHQTNKKTLRRWGRELQTALCAVKPELFDYFERGWHPEVEQTELSVEDTGQAKKVALTALLAVRFACDHIDTPSLAEIMKKKNTDRQTLRAAWMRVVWSAAKESLEDASPTKVAVLEDAFEDLIAWLFS